MVDEEPVRAEEFTVSNFDRSNSPLREIWFPKREHAGSKEDATGGERVREC